MGISGQIGKADFPSGLHAIRMDCKVSFMEGDMMDWLGSPTVFVAAILALPVLWFAQRSLADEDDRVGVLGVWFVMAVIVLYLLWYGGAWGVGKFRD